MSNWSGAGSRRSASGQARPRLSVLGHAGLCHRCADPDRADPLSACTRFWPASVAISIAMDGGLARAPPLHVSPRQSAQSAESSCAMRPCSGRWRPSTMASSCSSCWCGPRSCRSMRCSYRRWLPWCFPISACALLPSASSVARMTDAGSPATLSSLRRCGRDGRVRHGDRCRRSARACWRSMPCSTPKACRSRRDGADLPLAHGAVRSAGLRLRALSAAGARPGRDARSRARVRPALEGAGRLRRQVRHRPGRNRRAPRPDARAAHRQAHARPSTAST